jgi:hypothetical protein
MEAREIEDGKARILDKLLQAGKELEIPLPTHEWKQPSGSTVLGDHFLVLHFPKRVAVVFSCLDIYDCAYDESVRERIKARLKGLLHSF